MLTFPKFTMRQKLCRSFLKDFFFCDFWMEKFFFKKFNAAQKWSKNSFFYFSRSNFCAGWNTNDVRSHDFLNRKINELWLWSSYIPEFLHHPWQLAGLLGHQHFHLRQVLNLQQKIKTSKSAKLRPFLTTMMDGEKLVFHNLISYLHYYSAAFQHNFHFKC